jgi:hypothetical protein
VVNYPNAHRAPRSALPEVCSHADDTCYGRLECALRKDAPVNQIQTDDYGRRYFTGDPLIGYIRLCKSHHIRYDDPDGKEYRRKGRIGGTKSGAINKANGLFQSPRWRASAAKSGRKRAAVMKAEGHYGSEPQRVRGYKAACQRWNINRGKPCTCGQHEEAK